MPEIQNNHFYKFRSIRIFELLYFCVFFITPLLYSTLTIESGYLKKTAYECIIIAVFVGISCNSLAFKCFVQSNFKLIIFGIASLSYMLLSSKLKFGLFLNFTEIWRLLILGLSLLLTSFFFRNGRNLNLLLLLLGIPGFLVSIYGLVQFAKLDPMEWGIDESERVLSTIGNPNMLAGYSLMLIPIFTACSFDSERKKSFRVLSSIVATLLFLMVLLSGSKGALIACLISLIGTILYLRKEIKTEFFSIKAKYRFTIFLVIFGIFSVFAYFLSQTVHRISAWLKNDVPRPRLEIWKATIDMILDNFWFGVGSGNYAKSFPEYRNPEKLESLLSQNILHAHCEFLQIFAELGVVGISLYSILLIYIVALIKKVLSPSKGLNNKILIGIIFGIMGIFMHSQVSVILRWYVCPLFLSILLGVLIGNANALKQKSAEFYLNRIPKKLFFKVLNVLVLTLFIFKFSLSPLNSEILTRKGMIRMNETKYNEAELFLIKAIQWNNINIRAQYYLAYNYFQLQKHRKSIEYYNLILNTHPNYAQIHYNLMVNHLLLGDTENAYISFLNQNKIGGIPEDFPAEDIFFSIVKKNDFSSFESLQFLEKLTKSFPNNKSLLLHLGDCYFRKNDLDKAQKLYTEVLNFDFNNIRALNNLAGIYFNYKDFEKTILTCDKILEIQTNNITVLINKGKAHFMLSEFREAKYCWQSVLKIEPNHPIALQMLSKVKNQILNNTIKPDL
tara:strand:+ start:960 stop:3149 length:2190 start_codon:yes stop_codon:yes gene_type:complete